MNRNYNDSRRVEDIRAEALAILNKAGRENGLPPEEAEELGARVAREIRQEKQEYLNSKKAVDLNI